MLQKYRKQVFFISVGQPAVGVRSPDSRHLHGGVKLSTQLLELRRQLGADFM